MVTAARPSGETATPEIQSSFADSRRTLLSFTSSENSRTGGSCSESSTTCESSFSFLFCRSARVGSSCARNRMVALSRHSKARTPRSEAVSGHGSPPDGSITHSWVFATSGLGSGSGRDERKATSLPSGDQRGLEWATVPRVSWTSRACVRLERYRFDTRPLSASTVLFTHTTQRPSGEIWNWLACSAVRMSSMVQGDGAPAGAVSRWPSAAPGRSDSSDSTTRGAGRGTVRFMAESRWWRSLLEKCLQGGSEIRCGAAHRVHVGAEPQALLEGEAVQLVELLLGQRERRRARRGERTQHLRGLVFEVGVLVDARDEAEA